MSKIVQLTMNGKISADLGAFLLETDPETSNSSAHEDTNTPITQLHYYR